jgi:hypothetical protein
VRVARILQALVEEQLRGGQHHAAVDVVLALHPGQVAAPHRAHAAIAGQAGTSSSCSSASKPMPYSGCSVPSVVARLKM